MSHSQRNAEDGIGTQVLLGGSAVKFQHLLIDGALIQHAHALDDRSNLGVDVLHGLLDTLAQIAAFVTIAELQGLVLTSGSTGGNAGTSHIASLQGYFNLYSRITT